jgi:hypothetical protein
MSNRGYPLPDGDCYTEELCPVLICVPNKLEYFRALRGSLDYLGTWVAWQRDAEKRGRDAAAAWKYANEMSGLGEEMGCLDELIEKLDEIIGLIAFKKDCCDDNLVYGGQESFETDIVPGVGDYPEEWGGEELESWDDWYGYVCYAANTWVDALVSSAGSIDSLLSISGLSLGAVAAILSAVVFFTFLPVSLPVAAGILSALLGLSTLAFSGVAESIESARQDIVCAVILNLDVQSVVESAVGSVAWAAFFQFIDYDTVIANLYTGTVGENNLVAGDSEGYCDYCEYAELTPDDFYMNVPYGTGLSYDEESNSWTVSSSNYTGCQWIVMQFFEDEEHTVWKHVNVVLLSCTGSTSCGGAYHHRGASDVYGYVNQYNHPTLPMLGDIPVKYQHNTHNESFTIVFKVYEAPT